MLNEFVSVVFTGSFWLTFLLISAIPYGMYLLAWVGQSLTPGYGPGKIPFWRGQSRAFMPGDFGLALLVTVCLQYRSDVPVPLWMAFLSILAAAVVFAVFALRLTIDLRRSSDVSVPLWIGYLSALAVTAAFVFALLLKVWRLGPDVSLLFLSILAGVVTYMLARDFLYTPKDYSRAAWNSPTKIYHDVVMFGFFTAVAVCVCLPVLFSSAWLGGGVLVLLFGVFGLAIWIVGNVYDFTHDETPNDRQHPPGWNPIWRK